MSSGSGASGPHVDGSKTWKRMTFLTISSFGTQFVSAEMSQASPYLLSLGISKSQVALVLMAGPLSGLFTQPIVGLYGDRNPHRLGRRRPFVIYGGLCVLVSLFTFAWCKELAALIIHTGTPAHQSLSALLAVIAFYALDISINIVTVSNKCLIIDVLPSLEQQLANAYASRFSGVSAILTMLISLVDLPSLFGVSSSQLKMISFIGGPIFLVSHLAMCLTVHEARFVADDGGGRGRSSMVITATLRRFWEAWRALDGTIVKPICWIQLWAWLGWFPVIFYSTTWIGETWTRRSGATGPDEEKATRIGTIGLLVQAVLSLLGWLFIPRIVSAFRDKQYGRTSDGGKTLIDLWGGGQICFGFMLLISPFCEDSVALSIGLIGACGIPWAITCWVPFTLLGESLLHKAELATPAGNGFRLLPDTDQQPVSPRDQIVSSGHHSSSIPLKPMSEDPVRSSSAPDSNAGTKPMSHARKSEESEEEGVMEDECLDGGVEREDEGSQLAGTVLGIHNVFIVLPQFLISCLSSVLFKLLESDQPPSSSTPKTRGVSEIGIIFRSATHSPFSSALLCSLFLPLLLFVLDGKQVGRSCIIGFWFVLLETGSADP
ncbi:hypothetical protein PtB15_15B182 [Puccinia triticina]|nr:hypothetical protein PtB15_15B182 [Puccinia triticina]